MRISFRKGLLRILMLNLVLSPIAMAQQLEEIIVTAERRQASSQDVPISINAFTSDAIEDARIQDFADLGIAIPGFSINTFTKSRLSPSLRGGSSSLAGAGAEGAVGLFIDDLYYGGPGDFEIDLWDVERIEVLRGPQGTLFGRNTTGGSINVVTKNPSKDAEAKVEVTYGNLDLVQTRALVSGPLKENLYGLLTFQSTDRDGTAFNRTTGNRVDTINKSSIRGKLLWEPTENFRIISSASFTRHDETGIARDQVNFPAALDNTQLQDFEQDLFNPRVTTQFSDGRYDSDQITLGLRIEKDYDKGQFLSITSGRYFDSDHAPSSLTGAPIPIFAFGEPRNVETISQEFRYVSDLDGPFNYVAGVFGYYSDETRNVNATTNWDVNTVAGVVQAQVLCPFQVSEDVVDDACRGSGLLTIGNQTVTLDSLYGATQFRIFDNVKTTSAAVFGEGKYNLTDTLTATVGGRLTYDKKELDAFTEGAPDFVWNTVPGSIYQDDENWSEFTYRVGLDWKVSDDVLLYATNSTGFRAGAYDVTTSNPVQASTPLNPETVTSYEMGLKSRFLNDRVQLNLTYFDVTYENLQFFVTVAGSTDGVVTANAGEASVDGLEAELIAALTDDLTLSVQYSNQSGTSRDIPEETEVPNGTPPQGTVPNTYIVALNYETETASGGRFSAGIDWTKKDRYNLEFSTAVQFESEVKGLVNLRAGYEFPGDHWSVTAWVKNASDEDIITYGQDFAFPFYSFASFDIPGVPDAAQPRYTDPRTFGVTLGYEF